jgi:hypothetical protein
MPVSNTCKEKSPKDTANDHASAHLHQAAHWSDVTDHSEKIRPLRHPVSSTTVLHRRWVTRWPAELRTPNGAIACTVEDISRHGAKLRIGAAQGADENVLLVIGDFGPVAARVVWRVRGRAGVQFNSSQPWVLDLVMKAAKDNQWPPRTAR